MTSDRRSAVRARLAVKCWALSGALTIALTVTALAQQSQQQPEQQQSAQQTAPGYQPGLLDAVGRWLSGIPSQMLDVRSRIDEASTAATGVTRGTVDAARDTADTVVRLPATRVVAGRERCALAANGAPDCNSAAEAVCRKNGHRGGRSVDIQSSENCPARVWLSGRSPQPGECKTATFVTRALCQ